MLELRATINEKQVKKSSLTIVNELGNAHFSKSHKTSPIL